MKTIVISADNNIAKLLTSLAKKMGLRSYVLSDERKEDIALIRAIGILSAIILVTMRAIIPCPFTRMLITAIRKVSLMSRKYLRCRAASLFGAEYFLIISPTFISMV
jgi:hypothetical protein